MLPLAGGLVDQPVGVMNDMQTARSYIAAWQALQLRDEDGNLDMSKGPEWAQKLVFGVQAFLRAGVRED